MTDTVHNVRRISTGLTEPERLRELLYQAIRAPGMNPENVYLLLRRVLAQEYPEDGDLEEQSQRFHSFLTTRYPDGLNLQADQLAAMFEEFRHPHEDNDAETREWMRQLRERIHRLLPGVAKMRGGVRDQAHIMPLPHHEAPSGIVRRLNRDDPELARQVAAGEISANAAAIQVGYRKPKFTVPVDTAEHAMRALLRRFDRAELLAALKGIRD